MLHTASPLGIIETTNCKILNTMKKILLFLILTNLIVSCDLLNPKIKIYRPEKGKTIEEIIDNELATKKRNDTIFLDFRFGMTEKEFVKHLRKLINQEKLYTDPLSNFITYDLIYDKYTTIKCTFKPDYYKDKLYELGVSAKSQDNYTSTKTTTIQLMMFFISKYGLCDVEEKMELVDDCKEYIWIQGNRKISVMCGIDDSRIFYEDLSIIKLKEAEENKETESNTKESLNDI